MMDALMRLAGGAGQLRLSPLLSMHQGCKQTRPRFPRNFAALATPPSATASTTADDGSTEPKVAGPTPRAAYIHLPFCKKKCFYCDFPVIAVGARTENEQVQDIMKDYVDALCREISVTAGDTESPPLETVFFGGGTPSLIAPGMLEQILKLLDRRFGIANGAEISIEADPGTFDSETLRTYRTLGVSRVSIGVQAFDEELLKTCGRAHDLADAYRAIEAVHSSGMPSWSLDLMSGLPGLTRDGWARSLAAAIDADPSHISVYDLQIEEHTPFAKQYRPGVSPLPSDEDAAAMYIEASGTLRSAGFEHYEVSNYAKPGHRCKHNMTYWEGKPYHAFGMGAASYLDGRRFSRPRKLAPYLRWLEDMEGISKEAGGQGITPASDVAQETSYDRLTDTIMLRLRLSDGLDLKQIAEEYPDGSDVVDFIVETLKEHVDSGRAVLEKDDKGKEWVRAKLTDPEGFIVSNDVISDIFAALDEMKKN